MKRKLLIIAGLLILPFIAPPRVSTQPNPALQGQWSAVQVWPYRAIHAALLSTGKVLFWDSYELADNPRLWDPATGAVTAAAQAGYNIFCTGFTSMNDGRLFMAGGHISDNVGLPVAAIYNPAANTWTRLPNMNAGRWYPTTTNLLNADVLVLSGVKDTTFGMNVLPQVWQTASSSWRNLTNAQLQLPFYPFMFLAPNGRVFYAGPGQLTRYLDTNGTGAWTTVGNSFFGTRNWGSSVMYDNGLVLIVGGSQCAPYDTACSSVTATAEVVDLIGPSRAWRHVTSMAFPRKQLNLTLLPDGRVLATGGSSGALGYDDDTQPVYAAEVWSPFTEKWTTWASASVYRGYHTTALLLPDGRVLQAGGNKGGASAEVFSPPYLFNGARPVITSAPSTIGYGQTFLVQTAQAASIAQVTLLRLGSTTHSFNMSQRFNRLSYSIVSGGVNVESPTGSYLAPPGHYMLFILNTSGVPSVAKIVRLDGPSPPPPTIVPPAPANLTASAIGNGAIQLGWTDTSTDEVGFRIERCAGAACTNFAIIGTTTPNATAFTNNNAAVGVTYRYRVFAFNSAGLSAASNIANATSK